MSGVIFQREYRYTGHDRTALAGDLLAAIQLGLTVTVTTLNDEPVRAVRLIVTPKPEAEPVRSLPATG